MIGLSWSTMELPLSSTHPPARGCSPPSRCRHVSDSPEPAERSGYKVHVAVGKSVEKAVDMLTWTFRRFANAEICLLHVHQPSAYIPTLLGKLPASQASDEVVSSYRMEEREEMKRLLLNYVSVCRQSKVKTSTIVAEASQVQLGILDLVNRHGIRTLVMGQSQKIQPDVFNSCIKVKETSTKATFAAKNFPQFCEIWFVNKGKHVWTGEALAIENSSSTSAGTIPCAEIFEDEEIDDNIHFEPPLDTSSSRLHSHYPHGLSISPSTLSSSGYNSSVEEKVSPNYTIEEEEVRLSAQLTNLRVEAELSKDEAFQELLKRKASESRAVEVISKVKALETARANEIDLRKETEDELKLIIEEQEKLVEEGKRVTRELQKAIKNIAFLDCRAKEANHRQEEVAGELKLIQASISALHREKLKIRRQKMEATQWLDCWKTRGQEGNLNFDVANGSHEDFIELAEFPLADLQTATCDFSDTFKIGKSGYGSLYKGELWGRTVAIKRMHPQNVQSQFKFEQEVQALGKLQHPHLVTLLGVCSEAWSLIYEYLPNRSLQDHFSQRNNSYLLTWKLRARIISTISSTLLYLHSHGPVNTAHGGLKPENIIFDSDFTCKISDFGICRLIPEDTLRCPSFRQCNEPKGAFSYTDPEFHRTGHLTPKSDIYSFGLIILHLLTGKSPVGLAAEVAHAVSCGKTASILDLSAGEWPNYVSKRLIGLGLECCQLSSRDRPELNSMLVKELEQLCTLEERTAPSFFLCPILQEIMHDPRVVADGFTYEREALFGWLESGRDTSPMTNLKLDHLELTPNHALRVAIQDWICKS